MLYECLEKNGHDDQRVVYKDCACQNNSGSCVSQPAGETEGDGVFFRCVESSGKKPGDRNEKGIREENKQKPNQEDIFTANLE